MTFRGQSWSVLSRPNQPDEVHVTKLALKLMDNDAPNYMIAAALSVPPNKLSEYANARRKIPADVMMRMCEYFRCAPDDLLGTATIPDVSQ